MCKRELTREELCDLLSKAYCTIDEQEETICELRSKIEALQEKIDKLECKTAGVLPFINSSNEIVIETEDVW